jgi:hypothetical protein
MKMDKLTGDAAVDSDGSLSWEDFFGKKDSFIFIHLQYLISKRKAEAIWSS